MLKFLVILISLTVVSSRSPFFRRDYTYVEQYDSFYKLHWDNNGISWDTAFTACDDEGAAIFYPETKEEWSIVKSLVSSAKIKPNITDVLVGIHDEFGLGEFMTVDGLATPTPLLDRDQADLTGQVSCVTKDIDSGAYKVESCVTENTKPFVCKKKIVLDSCPTIDDGYTYEKSLKKCYKLNLKKKTWTDAMHTCFMEGSILAVIRNSEEAAIMISLIRDRTQYFVGFRKLFESGDFYTVKGQIFDETFYSRWFDIDNYDNNENDKIEPGSCGVVLWKNHNTGVQISTRNCNRPAPFVCEMSVRN